MTDDPLKNLRRLGEEALGPCAACGRVMLATGFPLFLRFRVQRCGIDAREVQRHIGLAQSIAPGEAGLMLAGIVGPGTKPVIVLDSYADANVCRECASTLTAEELHYRVMAREEEGQREAEAQS